MRTRDKTDGPQNGINFLVLVPRTAAKSIGDLLQEPLFIFGSIRVAQGRMGNSDFLGRENALTESLLTIALFEAAATLDSQTDKEPEAIKPKNRCKSFTLGPVAVLTIAQDNDTGFGPKGHELIDLFYVAEGPIFT